MKEYLQLFSRLCVSPLVSCTFLHDSFSLLFFPGHVLDLYSASSGLMPGRSAFISPFLIPPAHYFYIPPAHYFLYPPAHYFLYSASSLLFLLKTITYPKLSFINKVCVYLSDSYKDSKALTEYITICLKKHLPSFPPQVCLRLSYHLFVYIMRHKSKKKRQGGGDRGDSLSPSLSPNSCLLFPVTGGDQNPRTLLTRITLILPGDQNPRKSLTRMTLILPGCFE